MTLNVTLIKISILSLIAARDIQGSQTIVICVLYCPWGIIYNVLLHIKCITNFKFAIKENAWIIKWIHLSVDLAYIKYQITPLGVMSGGGGGGVVGLARFCPIVAAEGLCFTNVLFWQKSSFV